MCTGGYMSVGRFHRSTTRIYHVLFYITEKVITPSAERKQMTKSHWQNLRHLSVRKPTICICENKDADQLRGNREADQRLCFPLLGSYNTSSSLIQNFKPLAISSSCTAWFVSDLVRIPNCWFFHAGSHF